MAKLTIPDEPTIAVFTVTSENDTFPFDFAIFEKADLRLRVGSDDELGQGDFTLTGALLDGGGYQGGAVILNEPIQNTTLRIWRDLVPQRSENFGPVTSVPVAAVDLALSRQMAVVQDLRRDQDVVTAALPYLADLPDTVAQVFDARDEAVAATAGKADKAALEALEEEVAGKIGADQLPGAIEEALPDLISDRLKTDGTNAPEDAAPLRAAIDTPSRSGSGVSAQAFKAALNVWFLTFEDHGAVGDGVTNDRVACQAAIDAAALLKGAAIRMRPGKNYLIHGGDLVVKEAVYIEGCLSLPGVPGASNADLSNIWSKLASRLIIDPDYSIRLKGGAGLLGLFVVREGLTAQVLAHSPEVRDAAFAGTQILVEGEDTLCRDLLCLGGEYVWRCLGYNRAMVHNIRWDAREGFQSALSLDRAIMSDLHGWPFVTFGQLGNASSSADHQDHRPGIAYRLTGTNDWIELQRLFEYGHLKGFLLEVHPNDSSPLTVIFNGCGKDNLAFPPDEDPELSQWVIPGSIGVEITSGTDELRILGMTVAACDLAYSFTMTASQAQVVLTGSVAHGCRNGVLVNGGTVRMTSGWLRGLLGVYGVTDATTQGGTGIEVVSGQFISDRTLEVEKFTVAIDGNDVGGAFIGFPFIRDGGIANVALHPVTVTTEGTAVPNANFDQQILTGHSTLGTLGHTRVGHVVQFYFDDTITVLSAGNIKLYGGGDIICSPRDVLTLQDMGDEWVEVSRSNISGGGGGTGTYVVAYPDNVTPSATATPQPLIWANVVGTPRGNYDAETGVYTATTSELVSVSALLAFTPADATVGRFNIILLKTSGADTVEVARDQIIAGSTFSMTLSVNATVFLEGGESLKVTYFCDRAITVIGYLTGPPDKPISSYRLTAVKPG